MVKLLIELPASRATITIPLQHLTHYCGPRYHVGWLAGLGYAALHVEGDICHLDDDAPLDKSLAVDEHDVLKFIHDPSAAIRLMNLCNVRAEQQTRSSSSASSEDSNLCVDDVSDRDPGCVFTGWDFQTRPVYMLPVHVHTEGRFHEVADILGLQRVGELSNLLRVFTNPAVQLDGGNAFILASDTRFVPLAYLQGLEASKEALEQALAPKNLKPQVTISDIPLTGTAENHFQLFYQYSACLDEGMQFLLRRLGLCHQVVARFTPTAFDTPRSAPSREVYHYMYWGRMLLKYCDDETRERLQHVDPIVPKPPSVRMDNSDNPDKDEVGNPQPHTPARKAAGASNRPSKRRRQNVGGGTRGADVVDFLLAFQRCAAPPVEGPLDPDMPSGNDAVEEWRRSVQPEDD